MEQDPFEFYHAHVGIPMTFKLSVEPKHMKIKKSRKFITSAVGKTGVLYDDRLLRHAPRKQSHPEIPERIYQTWVYLEKHGTIDRCLKVVPAEKGVETWQLEEAHSQSHIWDMKSTAGIYYLIIDTDFGPNYLDLMQRKYENDVYFNLSTYECSTLACADLIKLCTKVVEGDLENGFALIRPPGHHAEYDAAMGFCIFNNVSVATRHLQKILDVERILIVDWDIHHGNGIQEEFYSDPNVLYISLHRFDDGDFYPSKEDADYFYIGEGDAIGKNVNIPWPSGGMTDNDYIHAFQQVVMPIAKEFDPDFVLVAAGFDAACGDPLGECLLSPGGYSQLTHMLRSLANGKMVMALEGGYNCQAIARSINSCIQTMLGDPPKKPDPVAVSDECIQVCSNVIHCLKPYWNCLRSNDNQPVMSVGHSNSVYSLALMWHKESLKKLNYNYIVSLDKPLIDNQKFLKISIYDSIPHRCVESEHPLVIFGYPGGTQMFTSDAKVAENDGVLSMHDSFVYDVFMDTTVMLNNVCQDVILLESDSMYSSRFPQYFDQNTCDYLIKCANQTSRAVVFVGVGSVGSALASLLENSEPKSNWHFIHLSNDNQPPDIAFEYLGRWWKQNVMYLVSSEHSLGSLLDLGSQGNVVSAGQIHYGNSQLLANARQLLRKKIISVIK